MVDKGIVRRVQIAGICVADRSRPNPASAGQGLNGGEGCEIGVHQAVLVSGLGFASFR